MSRMLSPLALFDSFDFTRAIFIFLAYLLMSSIYNANVTCFTYNGFSNIGNMSL